MEKHYKEDGEAWGALGHKKEDRCHAVAVLAESFKAKRSWPGDKLRVGGGGWGWRWYRHRQHRA